MNKKLILCILLLLIVKIKSEAQVHVNDNLLFNNGAELFIGTGALLTVQGDVTINQATVTGVSHLANNGFLWVQGNMYGDNVFKQSGGGTVRLQNKTTLYTAPYASESYQVIQGGYRVNGGQASLGAADDGSFFDLELDNQNGLIFIKTNTDVRNSVNFAPATVVVDGVSIAANGAVNRLLTYDPGTGASPASVPANGASYTAVFGMMNNSAGLANFKQLSANLEANTATSDNAYVQGKLRRAINGASGGLYGFPLGLEPSTSVTAARGIQYTKLIFAANTYDVLTGYFQQGSDNTDPSQTAVCSITNSFLYYGTSNHGEWVITPLTAAVEAYDLTVYPQDYGSVGSEKYFITKDNGVPSPGTQSCASSPEGLSVTGMTGFSQFGFAGGNSPMPVNLISMNVVAEQCTGTVKWVAIADQYASYFEVQESVTGKEWTTAAVVPAAGEINKENKYEQKIELRQGSTTLVRLKMVDFDGSYAYSRIRNTACNDFVSITMYPNPVESTLTVAGLPQGTNSIVIYNLGGTEMGRQSATKSIETVSFKQLPGGMYLIRVLSPTGGTLLADRIVK